MDIAIRKKRFKLFTLVSLIVEKEVLLTLKAFQKLYAIASVYNYSSYLAAT